MKKIKKIRNVVLLGIIILLAINLVRGMLALNSGFSVDKEYMHEPPGADITIVDFNQFGCDICRDFHPVLKEAMAKDGKVRYVPRIILPDSQTEPEAISVMEPEAVHAVYASAMQGKFIEMHHAIYENWPIKTRNELFSIAENLGLDIAQLQTDMDSEKVKQKIQEEINLVKVWKLPGVPAYMINQKMMFIPGRDNPQKVEDWLDRFERVRNQ